MPNHPWSLALLLPLAGAACVDTPPQPSPPTALTGTGGTLDPSIGAQRPGDKLRMVLTTRGFPDWRVESPRGREVATRRVEVVAGRRSEWLVRSDRAATVEIQAMRIRAQIEPGAPTTFGFLPLVSGEHDVVVRSGPDRLDGKLVVVTAQDRAAAELPEVVDEARLAATVAARTPLVALVVEQWRPTGNGDETMRWLVPIPVGEFAALDPLLASAERLLDPPMTLAIHGQQGLVHTEKGVYSFQFVADKTASETYRAILKPVDAGAGREHITLSWQQAVGERLMYELEWLVEAYAAKGLPTGETRGGPWFK
jgi:hypothetical protein